MRYRLFSILAFFFAAGILFASLLHAEDELLIKTYHVRVTSDMPAIASGQLLRIFKVIEGPLGLEPMPSQATFDDKGVCQVDLPPGIYRFELLSSAELFIVVAVHSPPVVVQGETTVKLISVDRGEVGVQVDKQILTLTELGIRSIGPADEDAQTAGFSSRIHLIANADETYSCRFIASNEDGSVTYVGWEPLKATANPKIAIHKLQYNQVTIGPSKEMPMAGAVTADLIFPTTQMQWEADPKQKLMTNRDFLTLSYRITSEDQSLQLLPIGYALQRITAIKLGGKLKASGYADAVFTKDGDNEGNRLFWVVSLTDANGQVLDDGSSINLKTYASLDNAAWTSESPYHQVDASKLNNLRNRLRLRLTSDLPNFNDVMVTPEPFVKIGDSKYSLRIPGSWAFRGRLYLSKLERLNAACRLATGRPGPAQVDINWRINFNDAWAIIGSPSGGGRGLWMSMQMKGLAVDNLFEEPWAMTHEMMHTFGYNHGPEMNKQINRALYYFNLGRWQAWDNRAYVP